MRLWTWSFLASLYTSISLSLFLKKRSCGLSESSELNVYWTTFPHQRQKTNKQTNPLGQVSHWLRHRGENLLHFSHLCSNQSSSWGTVRMSTILATATPGLGWVSLGLYGGPNNPTQGHHPPLSFHRSPSQLGSIGPFLPLRLSPHWSRTQRTLPVAGSILMGHLETGM